MRFQSAKEMLEYIQSGHDIWSPTIEKYVFLYGELGSICFYDDIYIEEAKELDFLSANCSPREYWCTFLGVGGHICDTLEWYHEMLKSGEKFDETDIYDHALNFCRETYMSEWVECEEVNSLVSSIFRSSSDN